jgi:hypothetical protein
MDTQSAKPIGAQDNGAVRCTVGLGARSESATSKWRRNNPERALAKHLKDEAKKNERKHEAGGRAETQTKCVECGMVFDRTEAHVRGFRILKGNRGYNCICDECA